MPFTARDLHAHFQRVGTWVDWEHTCDGFKFGDPETPVKGIAVGWQSLLSALEEAHARGCNLFITHEPTFYSHMDDDADWASSEPGQKKQAFLERTGMVIYRCHDVWDRFPKLGVRDAWSEFLELGTPIATEGYINLHEVPATTAWELAHWISRRVAKLGEESVQFLGTKWQIVHKLAVGTGAATNVRQMVALGADVLLASNDGTILWRDGAWLADQEIPLILVDHMTSEIPGLYKLVDYLREQFPQVPITFVGPTCSFKTFVGQLEPEAIHMRRDSLDDLPPITLPPGYTLRPMRADEVWAYLEVMNQSNFVGEADEAWFERVFSSDPEYDPSYIQLIWKGDKPVAGAAAWHKEIDGERWGLVHWVGVIRTERGKGLGKAITLAVLHKLRERGFTKATLTTGNWRLPAVAAYMRMGFKPWPTESSPQERWDRVLADLERFRKRYPRNK
ncbi:MAG: Nif3-like dinuclear metal center hexameric protein [Anaerolineae bacterium]|nr:Nif3-like dinuclear metal center hexameric protein [Anaerolineae bacterium]